MMSGFRQLFYFVKIHAHSVQTISVLFYVWNAVDKENIDLCLRMICLMKYIVFIVYNINII